MAACGAAVACAGGWSGEAAVVKLTLPELAAEADVIILGRITQVRSEPEERGGIWTVVTVEVLDALKGRPSPPVTIRVVGGTLGGRTLRLAEMPEFRAGEEAVLFLKRSPSSPHHEVVGAFQGKKEIQGGRVVSEKAPVVEFVEKIRRLVGH